MPEKKKRINGKKKGNAYELKIIGEILHWYENAVSSRSESKRLDDAGVDICYTPGLNIQCKAVEQSINNHDILNNMPQQKGVLNVVVHKRCRQGCTITLSKSDFYLLWDMVMKNKSKE